MLLCDLRRVIASESESKSDNGHVTNDNNVGHVNDGNDLSHVMDVVVQRVSGVMDGMIKGKGGGKEFLNLVNVVDVVVRVGGGIGGVIGGGIEGRVGGGYMGYSIV